MKKYIAEFIGTLVLVLAVSCSLAGEFPVPTPVIAGLALGYGVYAMGSISGAHFNPAITLGTLAVGKITFKDAILYLCAQIVGAAVAVALAKQMVVVPELPVVDTTMVFAAEVVGTFVFAFGVAAAVHGKLSQGASGLAVGGSLLLGISLAAKGSNGVLNPAVAFGIGSLSLFYVVAPIIGAILAMLVYKFISE
jgi:glycerol uptake facilitator-like aquaporin